MATDLLDFFASWAKQKKRWPLLLLLGIPLIFKFLQSYLGLPFRAIAQHPLFLSLSICVLGLSVGLYLALQYSNRVRYSKFAAALRQRRTHANRLLVSRRVAWQVLTENTANGTNEETVADMLARLAAGMRHVVVVLQERELDGYQVQEYDGLIIKGAPLGQELMLQAGMTFNRTRAEQLVAEVKQPLELQVPEDSGVLLFLPAKTYLRNQFLFSRFTTEAPLKVSAYGGQRASVAQLILKYALATMSYYNGDAVSQRLFREILEEGKLLGGMESEPLGQIFKTVGYYFAARAKLLESAIESLTLAHSFAPQDTEIEVMRAYLLLATGQKIRAGQILEKIDANGDNAAVVYRLKGEYLWNEERHADAIEAFKNALKHVGDPDEEPAIHLAVATVYGMTDRIDKQTRSSEMIAHLEEAIAREPDNPVFHVLQGFAWALQGNSELCQAAFERARNLPRSEENRAFIDYWNAKSQFELGRFDDNLAELTSRFGDPEKLEDMDTLLLFAQNLVAIPGKEAQAEKYLDRIIAADNPSGKVWRYKGLAVVARLMALDQLPTYDPRQRARLNEEARMYLLKSARSDDETASTHSLLATLYRATGDLVNARKHCNRALEIDPDDSDSLLLAADLAIDANELPKALEVLVKARAILGDNAEVEMREGLARQKAGDLKSAKDAYLKSLALAPDSDFVHDNVAFVLFDLGEFEEALRHWQEAHRINPENADAIAGVAIALANKGDFTSAIDMYRLAVEKDQQYLDSIALKNACLWSDSACKTAEPLIAALRVPPRAAIPPGSQN